MVVTVERTAGTCLVTTNETTRAKQGLIKYKQPGYSETKYNKQTEGIGQGGQNSIHTKQNNQAPTNKNIYQDYWLESPLHVPLLISLNVLYTEKFFNDFCFNIGLLRFSSFNLCSYCSHNFTYCLSCCKSCQRVCWLLTFYTVHVVYVLSSAHFYTPRFSLPQTYG